MAPPSNAALGSRPIAFSRSDLLAESCPWLDARFTHRDGGCSEGRYRSLNLGLHVQDIAATVAENRRRLAAEMDLPTNALTWILAGQVHGGTVASVDEVDAGRGADSWNTALPGVDGLVTVGSRAPLMLLFADCVPVIIADPVGRAVAALHAGWRGVAAGVVPNGVRRLRQVSGTPSPNLVAWIGPAIGACCHEVREDVSEVIAAATGGVGVQGSGGMRPRVDLKRAVEAQLTSAGVACSRVERSKECTACDADRYFSYRRDGPTGRMALVAVIR